MKIKNEDEVFEKSSQSEQIESLCRIKTPPPVAPKPLNRSSISQVAISSASSLLDWMTSSDKVDDVI